MVCEGPSRVSVPLSKAAVASKVHSLAEKRRRARINAHLSTLKTMIPRSNKIDKASLLGEVINQVKHLKRQATDICQSFPIPIEVNEVTVESSAPTKAADHHCCLSRDKGASLIRASICCDDRPELLGDLIGAFHELGLRTVRADLATLGGRVRNVFLLCKERCGGNSSATGDSDHACLNSLEESVREAATGDSDHACLNSLEESVREALGRIASVDDPVPCGLSSKRTRLLQSRFCTDVSNNF